MNRLVFKKIRLRGDQYFGIAGFIEEEIRLIETYYGPLPEILPDDFIDRAHIVFAVRPIKSRYHSKFSLAQDVFDILQKRTKRSELLKLVDFSKLKN